MESRPIGLVLGLGFIFLTFSVVSLEVLLYRFLFEKSGSGYQIELAESTAGMLSGQLGVAGPGRYVEVINRAERSIPGEIGLFSTNGTLMAGSGSRPSELGEVIATRTTVATSDQGQIKVISPVGSPGRYEAVLVLTMPLTSGDISLWTAHILVTVLLVASGGTYMVRRQLLKPLGEVQKTALQVANGSLGLTSPIQSPPEVAELAATLNHLSLSLKSSQDALVQTEKLASVGRLAAGLAHEIGNPLTAVRGYLDILLLELPPQSESANMVARARTEAERMHHILRDLLDFSRTGTRSLSPVVVQNLLDESTRTVRHQPAFREIQLQIKADPSLVILGDAGRLHQLLLNLLLNAAEAGATEVLLQAVHQETETGSRIEILCRDNGQGIPSENLNKVFEPFFTTRPTGKGTGLGLAVAHQVAAQHGGSLSVESQPGQGATFRLLLPQLAQTGID